MDLTRAEALARELMDLHGVSDGWEFGWSRSVLKYGQAKRTWRRGVYVNEIVLSKRLTEVSEEAKVRDTILHEIAHALVGLEHQHDSIWKAKCLEIGGDGQATVAGFDTVAKVVRYTYHCTIDDEILSVSQRRLSVVGWQCPTHGRGVIRKHIIDGERVQDLDYVLDGGVFRA
jgi:predicted SprT family Zn-dependent metalloprotease